MKLKLLIEHTGQSFTLKPETKYIVGSALDCTINLPNIDGIAERHIALSFVDNAWQVEDLNSTNGTVVNGQAINSYRIDAPVRIALAGNFLIAAAPLVPEIAPIANVPTQPIQPPTYQPPISPPPVYGSNPPPVYTSQSISPPSPYNDPYSSVSPPPIQPSIPSPRNQFNKRSPQVMTWWDFIDRQVEKGQSWLDQVAIRYFMTTGIRYTPYMKLTGGDLDGYIIPDFKGQAEEIAAGVAANLDQLRQYPDTDCNVVWLTDAHLTDGSPSPVLAFPIKRANRKDFRRFCVVSHHRIRTYVIIENYGSDLFVGRITRFEDQLNGFPLLLAGCAALLFTVLAFIGAGFVPFDIRASITIWSAIISLGLWFATFLGIPKIMRQLNSLPVPSNVTAVILIMLSLMTIFVWFLRVSFTTSGRYF
jgi:hypothetical protein